MKQRLSSLILALLTVLVFGLPSAALAAVLRDGVYLIQMSNSDWTVAGTKYAKGAPLVLWRNRPTATWRFTHMGHDTYKINSNSLVIDLEGSKRKNGVPIILWPANGGKNQLWKVVRKGQNYSLINVATGLALDLPNNRRVAGARLTGYKPNGSQAQLFKITPANNCF